MSYLGKRNQIVQIEAKTSNKIESDGHGVPQGSVLGGLLHIINSNDFPACHDSGESVIFVDDDSDVVQNKNPELLQNLIESEANNSAEWLKDNKLCVAAEKSKLLIVGSTKLKSSVRSTTLKIKVDGKDIVESESEKLLGVVMDNDLTWKSHLYGNEDNEGIVSQLSKRLGVLKKLAKFMPKDKLKLFANGIFYSKLIYCLPAFGNVFGLEHYKDSRSRYSTYTKRDNNKLQVLQNRLNKLLINADSRTSTLQLLKCVGSMSIQQLIAYHTAVTAFKIMKSKKPSYIAAKLIRTQNTRNTREKTVVNLPKYKLSSSREGFIYRSAVLLNRIGENACYSSKITDFKRAARKWVLENVKIKP